MDQSLHLIIHNKLSPRPPRPCELAPLLSPVRSVRTWESPELHANREEPRGVLYGWSKASFYCLNWTRRTRTKTRTRTRTKTKTKTRTRRMSRAEEREDADCVCSVGMKFTWDINDPKLPQVTLINNLSIQSQRRDKSVHLNRDWVQIQIQDQDQDQFLNNKSPDHKFIPLK